MFTLQQIDEAHNNVKTGADFPQYIKQIKGIGVTAFETWVSDSHTEYFGRNSFRIKSPAKFDDLIIIDESQKEQFINYLKLHQCGETDYNAFCHHCAESGIERWVVDLDHYTCTYYNKLGEEVLLESLPQL